MNFRIKALMQTVFGFLPNSEEVNYFAQRHITKSLPPSRTTYNRKFGRAKEHDAIFRKYHAGSKPVVYEIGCGWDLTLALSLSIFGYKDIRALDVSNHVRPELINAILAYHRENGVVPADFADIDSARMREELLERFGITLMAPCDSANTGMADQSVDLIYSQEVFEHIAPELLPGIMKECRRVLRDDGVISFYINYADHYFGTDPNVTRYNFLRYSEKAWKKYNPDLHYVNRLRHVDFVRLFKDAGFDIIHEETFRPEGWERMLAGVPVHRSFTERYSTEELSFTSGRFVLKKKQ